jgi:hypothetical protein
METLQDNDANTEYSDLTSAQPVIDLRKTQGKNKDEEIELLPDSLDLTFSQLVSEPSKFELAKADFKNFLKLQPEIERVGKEKHRLKKRLEELRRNFYASPRQFRYTDENKQAMSGLQDLSDIDYFKMQIYIKDAYSKIKMFDILVKYTM